MAVSLQTRTYFGAAIALGTVGAVAGTVIGTASTIGLALVVGGVSLGVICAVGLLYFRLKQPPLPLPNDRFLLTREMISPNGLTVTFHVDGNPTQFLIKSQEVTNTHTFKISVVLPPSNKRVAITIGAPAMTLQLSPRDRQIIEVFGSENPDGRQFLHTKYPRSGFRYFHPKSCTEDQAIELVTKALSKTFALADAEKAKTADVILQSNRMGFSPEFGLSDFVNTGNKGADRWDDNSWCGRRTEYFVCAYRLSPYSMRFTFDEPSLDNLPPMQHFTKSPCLPFFLKQLKAQQILTNFPSEVITHIAHYYLHSGYSKYDPAPEHIFEGFKPTVLKCHEKDEPKDKPAEPVVPPNSTQPTLPQSRYNGAAVPVPL
jgi:hypothetical protein